VAALGSAGLAGGAAAQEDGGETRPDFGGYIAESDGGYLDARGQDQVSVDVGASGNGGNFAFRPAGLWIDPGTTVVWEWTGEGGQHNVVDEAGAFESDLVAEAGFTFEYTFEEGGVTEYYCQPHKALGMKGAIAVGEDVPTVQIGGGGGGGDGGGAQPYRLPGDSFAQTMAAIIFGFLGLVAAALLGAEGYASYRQRETAAEAAAAEPSEGALEPGAVPEFTEEAAPAEPVNEIGHDGYDPTGTLTLIVIYFLILALMWVFMYFVEFLGNGPTVIG
jgi:halocyanin-like protein